MKSLLLLVALWTAFASQAAESDVVPAAAEPTAAASAPIKLPPGRCPTMPRPKMLPLNITGNFLYIARFTLKADGRPDSIRVEGRGPKELAKSVANSIGGLRCLPADADQEIAMEFRFKIE